MMKITHILICLIAFSLSSCLKEEVNIFTQSPAERLNLALKDDKTALLNASNGWVMQYFANPTSAGYNLLVKFNASGMAVFAAKNEFTLNKAYVTDSSLFQLVGDNGPVLTFNTYNKILHVFSNPIDPNETPELTGFGLEGDYEFVVTKVTADQITLKGKKHGSIIFLNKLQNNVSWLQYVQDLDAMDSLMFSNVAPKLTMTIGKST